jgi:hypothetical protein
VGCAYDAERTMPTLGQETHHIGEEETPRADSKDEEANEDPPELLSHDLGGGRL